MKRKSLIKLYKYIRKRANEAKCNLDTCTRSYMSKQQVEEELPKRKKENEYWKNNLEIINEKFLKYLTEL